MLQGLNRPLVEETDENMLSVDRNMFHIMTKFIWIYQASVKKNYCNLQMALRQNKEGRVLYRRKEKIG